MKHLPQIAIVLFLVTTHVHSAAGQSIPNTSLSNNHLLARSGIVADSNILDKARELTEEAAAEAKKKTFTANVSAYTAAFDETGSGDGITASGEIVAANHTIACPREYAFGTKVHFEGYGTYTCEDRGGAIKHNKFDIYMVTKGEAFSFGRRNIVAHVVG